MDSNGLEQAREGASADEVDLIDSYAAGDIGRRSFMQRGAALGLGAGVMASVIAACGGDDDDTSEPAPSDDGGSEPAASDDDGDDGLVPTGGVISIAVQPSSSGLDPVQMLDQATYNICSQSFEYLVGVGEDGNIAANALATDWSVNDDGTVWTFQLRQGATWMGSGNAFTSADVAATMDRAAEFGNAGLAGVIDVGSVDASDPTVAVFTLINPNGNFPVLVSNFNAQSLITPADYETGTLLNERPEGTGPWMLDDYDPAVGAKFVPNTNWWGPCCPPGAAAGAGVKLDGLEILHFDTIDTMVTAVAAGEVDAIQQFNVIGGENLLDNPDFVVLTPPSGTHRQIWFNTRNGQFTDPLVRQAMAWTFDRDRFVSTLFNGLADKGNDFPIPPSFTTWFPGPEIVEQRNRDIDKAVELLGEAGVDGLSSVINCGEVQEVPDLAALMQQDARDAGFDLSINVIPQATFYDDSWCPPGEEGDPPCLNSDDFGIVDWGHRPTPDVWLTSALQTDAVWNASVYADAEYDALVTAYQGSFTPEDQKAAIEPIAIKLWNDVPAIYPYFYNYLSGHRTNVAGMQSTALGHSIMINATKS